jgi:SAM-dependent methyltransferase
MSKSAFEARLSDAHYQLDTEYERSYKAQIRAMVPDTPPLRILDVGCGTGLNTSRFVAAGHRVTGIDLSSVAVAKYCARGFDGHVCDIEAGPLQFEPGSFDLVFASGVIEHCSDTAVFLQEAFRMTKPGGRILVLTSNSAFWAYRLLSLFGKTATELQHPGHIRFFSIVGLSKAIKAAGFELERIVGRNMYVVLPKEIGDPISGLLRSIGFEEEPRFATRDHFWQLSRLVNRANPFWTDTFTISATRPR